VAYQLALPLSWGIHNVFHVSLLLPYKETTTHGPNFERPPPDLIEDEEEYEVEAIVNHRYYGHRHQLQYLIKWKGYPSSDNTWEPLGSVHTEDLVKEYHRRHPLESNKKTATRGTRKLIRVLLSPTPSSSTDRIRTWLRRETRPVPLPPTRDVPPQVNKYSPSPPTSRWPSKPSKWYRSGSQGRARETPGSSYNNSPISYEPMYEVGKAKERVPAVELLQNALLRMTRRQSFPRIPPCQTLPK